MEYFSFSNPFFIGFSKSLLDVYFEMVIVAEYFLNSFFFLVFGQFFLLS